MAAPEPEEEQYDDEGMAAWYAAAAAGEDEGDDAEEDLVEAVDDPYSAFDDTEEAPAEVAPEPAAAAKEEPPTAKAVPTAAEPKIKKEPVDGGSSVVTHAPSGPVKRKASEEATARKVQQPAAKAAKLEEFELAPDELAKLTSKIQKDFEEPTPEVGAREGSAQAPVLIEGDPEFDEKLLSVRQGQVHVELNQRSPPMQDADLIRFCDWLDEQLPQVVRNYPYVRNSGAYLDLSDNNIGPEGLDKIFRVLRAHRVPCLVLKAYRNRLDDSIVDTLIEYLYTQPESFPMHGIHISHNQISDKGAMRLLRAAAQCGHYPRLTSRLPLWLRLEFNAIQFPEKVIADCLGEGFNVCLMKDGLCSRPKCNHYSGVHVQLPYFFNQHSSLGAGKGKGKGAAKGEANAASDAATAAAPASAPASESAPALTMMQPTAKARPTQAPQPSASATAEGTGMPTAPPGTISAPPVLTPHPPAGPPPARLLQSTFRARDVTAATRDGSWHKLSGEATQSLPDTWGTSTGSYQPAAPGLAPTPPSMPPPAHLLWPSANPWGGGGWWGKGGKGKGKGKWRPMWQGPSLLEKSKQEVRLTDADPSLGFLWQFIGEGRCPQVTTVEAGSMASQAAQPGKQLLRINGLDTSIFSQKQVTDMLRQRPITLRFGDQ